MNEVLLFSNVSVKHDSKKQNHKNKATDQFFHRAGLGKSIKDTRCCAESTLFFGS